MNLSYAHGPSDVALLDQTIGENLRATVERFPEREALVVAHQHYRATYAELWLQVDRVARALIAHGVRKGDRVGIWAPNRHEWVVTQFATARAGAILVTINPGYKAAELRHALNTAGVSLLVHARGFRETNYVTLLDTIRADCPALRETIVLEDDWDAFVASGERVTDASLAAREASLHPDDAINIQYTSGTTGAPKGATLTHHNILNNAYFTARTLRLRRARPSMRTGAALPHVRHGARHPRLRNPRRMHGPARRVVRRHRRPRDGRDRALHLALRRADDVHRRTRRARLRALRSLQPSDRDDGRRSLPGRGDDAGARAHAHGARSRSSAA